MAAKSRFVNILKYILSLAIGGALMYWLFRDLDWDEFWAMTNQTHWEWLGLSGLMLLLSHLFRAMRWRHMLEASGHYTSLMRAYWALLVGYFMNLLVPRLGEVSRCGVLNRTDRIPLSVSVGTVVAERVIDLLFLAVILGLTFLLNLGQWETFSHALMLDEITFDRQLIFILLGSVVVIALICYGLYRRLWNSEKGFVKKVRKTIEGLWSGIITVGKVKKPLVFWANSFTVWILYLLMVVSLLKSLPFTAGLGLGASMAILTAGSVAMVAPVQGGIGAYHYMVSRALIVLYAVPETPSEGYALISHTGITLVVAVSGVVAFAALSLYKKPKHGIAKENLEPGTGQ